jgi:hypothetical protein
LVWGVTQINGRLDDDIQDEIVKIDNNASELHALNLEIELDLDLSDETSDPYTPLTVEKFDNYKRLTADAATAATLAANAASDAVITDNFENMVTQMANAVRTMAKNNFDDLADEYDNDSSNILHPAEKARGNPASYKALEDVYRDTLES